MSVDKTSIILFGPPGSGKGTQGELLVKQYNFHRISPGDIMRKRAELSDEFGESLRQKMASGMLLEPAIVNKAVLETVEGHSNNSEIIGYLYDGYPRSIVQNEFFYNNILKDGLCVALYLKIELNLLFSRLENRFLCAKCGAIYNHLTSSPSLLLCEKCGEDSFVHRPDDTSREIIQKRFSVFEKETLPVIEYYQAQNHLITLDASKTEKEIFTDITNILRSKNIIA